MFTGIIEAIGSIRQLEPRGGDMRLHVSSGKLDMHDVKPGDSIATNGVCLTVVDFGDQWYSADVSRETLSLTTLGKLKPGSKVNLEKAMAVGDRLGGHIVSGHIDGMGTVIDVHQDARSWRYRLRAPDSLARYIAHKGSICVDGVSLTVNRVEQSDFELNIIPVTLKETVFGDYRPGSDVNLEVDVIARYLERLLSGPNPMPLDAPAAITREFLARNGYNAS